MPGATRIALATTAFTLAGLPQIAQAQEPLFDGPRVEAIGGYDQTDAAPGRGAQDGALFGARIGYDRDFGPVVIGAEADIAWSGADTRDAGFASSADRYGSVALRAGVKPLHGVLLFTRGGLGNARIATSLGTFDQTGFVLGGGGEVALGGRFFLRGEYRYSDYGTRLRGQQYVTGLGLRF